MSIRFSSIIWVQVSFSERRAPFFTNSLMWFKKGFFTVSSEVSWSSSIEMSLLCQEFFWLEPRMSFLEAIFLSEASSGNFSVRSTKFWISGIAWNETSILWDSVLLQWHGFLLAHIMIACSIHVSTWPVWSILKRFFNWCSINRWSSPVPFRLAESISSIGGRLHF